MRNATFTCRAVANAEGKARTIRFVGATEDVARDGGILKMEGWQLDDYRANPVFLWAHDQKQPPIGRAVRVSRGAEGLEFDIEFAPADVYPFADLVGRLYESGFMRAVSVGFRVLQERAPNTKERQAGAQWVSEAHELLELSAVPVGADASALAAARGACRQEDVALLRGMGGDFERLAREVEVPVIEVQAEVVEVGRAPEDVDLMPTKGMKEEAERYRAWKAEGREGGTEVAARRASQILSGEPMPEDAVVAMNAWFARHEVDKQGTGFSPGEEGYPSPGRVAWAAWGGDAGQSWAAEKVAALERGARPYDASGKKIKNPTPAQIAAYEEAKEDEEEKGRQEGDGAAAILEALSRDTAAVMEALGRLEAKMDVLSSILVIDEDDLDDTTQEAADAAAPAVDAPVEGSRAAATPDPYDILKKARLYAGRKD